MKHRKKALLKLQSRSIEYNAMLRRAGSISKGYKMPGYKMPGSMNMHKQGGVPKR